MNDKVIYGNNISIENFSYGHDVFLVICCNSSSVFFSNNGGIQEFLCKVMESVKCLSELFLRRTIVN